MGKWSFFLHAGSKISCRGGAREGRAAAAAAGQPSHQGVGPTWPAFQRQGTTHQANRLKLSARSGSPGSCPSGPRRHVAARRASRGGRCHLGVQLLRLSSPCAAPEAEQVARVGRAGHHADSMRPVRRKVGGHPPPGSSRSRRVGDVRERGALALRDVAQELDVGVVHEDADERHHGDAVALDGAAAREGLGLVLAVERVEEARRRLHADSNSRRRAAPGAAGATGATNAAALESARAAMIAASCLRSGEGAVGCCAMASGVISGPVCPGSARGQLSTAAVSLGPRRPRQAAGVS